MAKVNFNSLDEAEFSSGSGANNGNDVGFFTLKNDNDEAVVRFMCDSTDDFEILTVHDVQLGQRYRKVNCIRDPREPLDNCPLCKSGAKISNRFFIKLIQYTRVVDPATGAQSIVPQPMVWERSTSYAKTLKSYLDNYGPLSDIICKIIRHGKAGDMQTTYEIVPNLSKSVFPDEVYVKDPTLFGTFEAFGTIVMNKTYEEMEHFLVQGEFPIREKKQDTAQTQTPQAAPINQGYVAPQFNQTAAPAFEQYSPSTSNEPPQETYAPATGGISDTIQPSQQPVNNIPQGGWGQPTPRTMPWDNNPQQNAGGFERPRRY